LQHIHDSSHVTITESKNRLDATLLITQLLRQADFFNALLSIFQRDVLEFESRASRLQGWDDLRDIIADHAESSVAAVFLDD